jgi:hypothetical protein
MEKDFEDKLKHAKSQEEIERIKAERIQARMDIQAGHAVKPHAKAAADEPKPVVPPKSGKRTISDNPLDGLDLDEPSSPKGKKK